MLRAEKVALRQDRSRIPAMNEQIVAQRVKEIQARESAERLKRLISVRFAMGLAIVGFITMTAIVILARYLD
jgi:hypothetical protein